MPAGHLPHSPWNFASEVHREGTKNAKIVYISLVLRALRVFAMHKINVYPAM
jgi:hypothetical protein